MDPDATLEALRRTMDEMAAAIDTDDTPCPDHLASLASAAVDLFRGLDGWMSKKGFLPQAWTR